MDASKVAIVWRGPARERGRVRLADTRFAAIAHALADAGFSPEPCIYDEPAGAEVRSQLLGAAAALVFVNPLQDGRRRYELDAILRDVAHAGVRVSAHPDVVDAMGVKAVLWRTRDLGWGSDVHFHEDPAGFARSFPGRLAQGARVLKPNRGNGGQGVWKAEAAGDGLVRIEPAEADAPTRTLSLAELLAARASDFAEAGGLVDQAWQPRIGEGMMRCYMAGDRAAGFGAQKVRALAPAAAGPGGPRLYSGPDDPRFQRLRALMEREWTPALCRQLDIDPADLPVIWDADFMLGPRSAAGEDTFVLCEINVSSVFPIPEEAASRMAARLRHTMLRHGGMRDRG